MDADGEGITIQGISPERASVLVPKLIKAMLMFDPLDAKAHQIGRILNFVAGTPGYNRELILQAVNEKMDELARGCA